MIGHGKRSNIPMHATPTSGTRTPTHLRPGHQGPAMLDHPAGGGDMPLPQGGPGGSLPAMHETAMPRVGGLKMPRGKGKMPGY